MTHYWLSFWSMVLKYWAVLFCYIVWLQDCQGMPHVIRIGKCLQFFFRLHLYRPCVPGGCSSKMSSCVVPCFTERVNCVISSGGTSLRLFVANSRLKQTTYKGTPTVRVSQLSRVYILMTAAYTCLALSVLHCSLFELSLRTQILAATVPIDLHAGGIVQSACWCWHSCLHHLKQYFIKKLLIFKHHLLFPAGEFGIERVRLLRAQSKRCSLSFEILSSRSMNRCLVLKQSGNVFTYCLQWCFRSAVNSSFCAVFGFVLCFLKTVIVCDNSRSCFPLHSKLTLGYSSTGSQKGMHCRKLPS